MKKIVCEMCGSNDLLKKDGVFECQNCGTKYSVEEAKKMMVDGTVKIDRSDDIEKYLKIALSALEGENYKEAEDYANKIIEIDSKNSQAWHLKGKAVGWQSNIDNNRFSESVECWSNAISYCEENKVGELIKEILTDLSSICMYIIVLKSNNFSMNLSTSSIDKLLNIQEVFEPIIQFSFKTNFLVDINIFFEAAAKQMVDAAIKGSENADNFFGPTKAEKTKDKYTLWIDYIDNCLTVLRATCNLAKTKETIDKIFETMESLQNKVINSCSYENSSYGYIESASLNATAKALRKKEIETYPKQKQQFLSQIEKEEKEKKKEYWESHPEEKEKLEEDIAREKEKIKEQDKKLNELKSEKLDLEQKLNEKVPSESELKVLNEKTEKLLGEKNNLGLFKSKEKKAIQEQIDDIELQVESVNKKIAREKQELKKGLEPNLLKIEDEIDKLNKDMEKSKQELEKLEKEL